MYECMYVCSTVTTLEAHRGSFLHAAYTLDSEAGHRQIQAPAGEKERAGQVMQVPEAVAEAAGEKVPAGQSVQAPGPGADLYLPATHAVHVPPFDPV